MTDIRTEQSVPVPGSPPGADGGTQHITTPRVRQVIRRLAFWGGALAFLLILSFLGLALSGTGAAADRLDPGSPAPGGAKAVVEVLRDQGVTVTATTSLDETEAAVGESMETTLLLYDEGSLLDPAQLQRLARLSDNLVLIDPSFLTLETLLPAVAQAGFVDSDFEADCPVRAVERAGIVSGESIGYRLIDTAAAAAELCLGSGDEIYSLIRADTSGGTVTVLGASDALSNEKIILAGNAALALGLLGERSNLIWYLPSLADVADAPTAPATLAEASPDWVIPLIALLAMVALAAAFWRGRRFGPLVIENLPVAPRASETMEGRARLYQKTSARLRTLDALRIGSIERLAETCGLPRRSSVDEVIAAVAAVTGRPLSAVRTLLLDAHPSSDIQLVRLSDDLLDLERSVAAAVRPE